MFEFSLLLSALCLDALRSSLRFFRVNVFVLLIPEGCVKSYFDASANKSRVCRLLARGQRAKTLTSFICFISFTYSVSVVSFICASFRFFFSRLCKSEDEMSWKNRLFAFITRHFCKADDPITVKRKQCIHVTCASFVLIYFVIRMAAMMMGRRFVLSSGILWSIGIAFALS